MKTPGSQAQQQGKTAEKTFVAGLIDDGWITTQSPELDYGAKTDVLATCPVGVEVPVQISLNAKSNKQLASLERRGITPVSMSELNRTRQTPGQFLCNACDVKICNVS